MSFGEGAGRAHLVSVENEYLPLDKRFHQILVDPTPVTNNLQFATGFLVPTLGNYMKILILQPSFCSQKLIVCSSLKSVKFVSLFWQLMF